MKIKLLTAFAFAASVFAVSCQKDMSADSDLVQATFTIVSPDEVATKAVADGLKSKNLVFAVFPYDINAEDNSTVSELRSLRQGDWNDASATEIKFNGNREAIVNVTLVRGKAYQFVCWAQKKELQCYDFSDMSAIKVSYEGEVSQNEDRDAFYALDTTKTAPNNPVVVTKGFSQTITLRRPFAQINMGSSDMLQAKMAGLDTTKINSSMVVKGVANQLNTLTGEAVGTVDASFSRALAITNVEGTENLYVNDDPTAYGWLAMNYVLVNTKESLQTKTHEVTVELFDEAQSLVKYDVTQVTLARNYRTHLVGDVLTTNAQLNVVIDPFFYNDDIVKEVE